MCGLAGIVNFAGKPIDPARLGAAGRALRHRGPDDVGSWFGRLGQATVALHHRRLAIIDLSHEAAQPMWDASGRVGVVFNGEIFNFPALRDELKGRFAFRTRSDTEVILAAYAAWGPDAWDRLAGMWAIALLDAERNELWLSRDRMGIKPLWYARIGEELLFASELPGLLAMLPSPPPLDPAALAQYLALGTTLSPATVLRDVRKLPPGSALRVLPAGPAEVACWYRPRPVAHQLDRDGQSFAHTAGQFRSRLIEVVRDHLIADVPVGVLLSGGVDSSVIAAAATQARGAAIRTFCVGFADQPAYDEASFAAAVAHHLGCQHTALHLSLADIHHELPGLLDSLDEPFGDSSYLPTALLSRITRQHVTVALSGDGGDELFAGYWRYRGHRAWRLARLVPAPGRRAILAAAGWLPTGRSSGWRNRVRQLRKLLAADSTDSINRHLTWARIADEPTVATLVRDPAVARQGTADIEAAYRAQAERVAGFLGDRDPLNVILAADLFTLLPDDMLHKVDRGSMRCALEVRVPLLDHRVVEFVLGLPMAYKLRRGAAKRMLRAAFAQDLPAFVFTRPKRGFEVPVSEFFRTAWFDLTRDVFLDGALERCGVSSSAAVDLLDQHREGRHDHSQVLFALLTLAWWAARHLANSGGTAP